MHLFLSDLHLGREPHSTSRDAERDAVDLLEHYGNALAEGGSLFLVGDIFHAYIEYKHVIPKCGARLIGRIASLVDHGIPVTYLIGNRDPWHVDFFEKELGVRLVRGSLATHLAGRRIYIAHGDVELFTHPLTTRWRSFLRHPVVARFYRNSFPGDAALGFARWFSRAFGTDPRLRGGRLSSDAERLANNARDRLNTSDYDLVVHGHTHRAHLAKHSSGTYVNPGYWFADRTFALLTERGPELWRFANGQSLPLDLNSPDASPQPA